MEEKLILISFAGIENKHNNLLMLTKLKIEMLIFEFKFILIIHCKTQKITRNYLFNLKQKHIQPFINMFIILLVLIKPFECHTFSKKLLEVQNMK